MLLDISCAGTLFPKCPERKKKLDTLLAFKSSLTPDRFPKAPPEFLDFYMYVRNLPATNEPNYVYWKKVFKRCVAIEVFKRPYLWSIRAQGQADTQEGKTKEEQAEES